MKFSARDDIGAPIEEVFAALTDFQAMERAVLRRGAQVQRTDTLAMPGPGMSWEARFSFRGKDRVLTTELVQLNPPEVIGLKSQVGGLHGLTGVELVPLAPRQTRLVVALELTPHSMSGRIFLQTLRLARAKLKQRFAAAVHRFGREIEAGNLRK
ncbi:polyketide cyclase/dehydrase/lipid transport protein [Rhodovulum bhavnagarense]|uniref:Polyketide cyclase/dehydrase/lipid transport protein n=1 Tax=Rhodovulum bhavnagarense TaxID=992286 RepID=A0A4R2RD55_9RHOB|nr:SRPBCC family protein [Rhodovulum bhavnagarense]TCP60743.1 polyketide cyclase/dehydrase/lipid transport protein [Rhodovulum bhavnagarense]